MENGKRGVPQGSQLSPFLFILYMADLLEDLSMNGFLVGAFVDDIRIVLPAERIKDCCLLLEDWAQENFMIWGVKEDGSKSAILVRRLKPSEERASNSSLSYDQYC